MRDEIEIARVQAPGCPAIEPTERFDGIVDLGARGTALAQRDPRIDAHQADLHPQKRAASERSDASSAAREARTAPAGVGLADLVRRDGHATSSIATTPTAVVTVAPGCGGARFQRRNASVTSPRAMPSSTSLPEEHDARL